MILEIKNLLKKYDNREVVKNVSFTVERGEIVCILGPSGCGKTTVLNSIGGFIPIDAGEIILDGVNIEGLEAENRPVATVFQSYGLFPHKSVMENIVYGLKFQGYKKSDALLEGEKMLKTLNLSGYGNKKVTSLSGGEQQRVALGRSLIVKPKLLLLDEPLSNLDTKLRVSMREELLRIRDLFEISMIFVTHDQEDAFSISDKIILMNKGSIEQIDRARELYLNPKTEFALDFIGNANIFEESYVRPEAIIVAETGQEGLVRKKTFKGFFIEYEVEVEKRLYKMIRLNREAEYELGDKILIEMEERKI